MLVSDLLFFRGLADQGFQDSRSRGPAPFGQLEQESQCRLGESVRRGNFLILHAPFYAFASQKAMRNGLKPEDEKPASPPPLKWRGLRRVHAVNETHQAFFTMIRSHWRGWNPVLFED